MPYSSMWWSVSSSSAVVVPVHTRWAMVVIPNRRCTSIAKSAVRSRVVPAAPQVIETKAGSIVFNRSMARNKARLPASSLGVKNSSENTGLGPEA